MLYSFLSSLTENYSFLNALINGSPIKKTTTNDVITESPVLNVMYLNTFKKE